MTLSQTDTGELLLCGVLSAFVCFLKGVLPEDLADGLGVFGVITSFLAGVREFFLGVFDGALRGVGTVFGCLNSEDTFMDLTFGE